MPSGWARPQQASCYSPALLMLPVWLELGSATGLLRSSMQDGTDASRPGRGREAIRIHSYRTAEGCRGETRLGHDTEFPSLPRLLRGLIQPSMQCPVPQKSSQCNSLEDSIRSPWTNIWKSLPRPPEPAGATFPFGDLGAGRRVGAPYRVPGSETAAGKSASFAQC